MMPTVLVARAVKGILRMLLPLLRAVGRWTSFHFTAPFWYTIMPLHTSCQLPKSNGTRCVMVSDSQYD